MGHVHPQDGREDHVVDRNEASLSRASGNPGGAWLYSPAGGPLAQLVEQGTLNPKVAGSIPARPIANSL
jgi:hypothetical protein